VIIQGDFSGVFSVPKLDTLVLFWSDLIPHEVLPPKGNKSRRAISVWYLCPALGSEQFVDGSPLPTDGLTASEAAAEVLERARWGHFDPRIVARETRAWLVAQASAEASQTIETF
jgi:hypothetical protein